MRRIVITFLLLAVVSGGCSLFEPREEEVLMPLAVGNEWTYIVAENKKSFADATYRVVREVERGRFTFAVIAIDTRRRSTGVTTTDTLYAYNESGLFLWDSPERNRLISYFRYPIDANTSYQDPNQREICVRKRDDMTVSAGTFAVTMYGSCSNFLAHRTMFAPGIGLVFEGNFETTAIALDSYNLQ